MPQVNLSIRILKHGMKMDIHFDIYQSLDWTMTVILTLPLDHKF